MSKQRKRIVTVGFIRFYKEEIRVALRNRNRDVRKNAAM